MIFPIEAQIIILYLTKCIEMYNCIQPEQSEDKIVIWTYSCILEKFYWILVSYVELKKAGHNIVAWEPECLISLVAPILPALGPS